MEGKLSKKKRNIKKFEYKMRELIVLLEKRRREASQSNWIMKLKETQKDRERKVTVANIDKKRNTTK